jgi:hypothetical protein
LSPDDEFFAVSLEKLREDLESLDDDRRADEKYSLISKCTLIAEASGGNSKYPSGGTRICAEEVDAVKHIARLLSGAIDRKRAETPEVNTAVGVIKSYHPRSN